MKKNYSSTSTTDFVDLVYTRLFEAGKKRDYKIQVDSVMAIHPSNESNVSCSTLHSFTKLVTNQNDSEPSQFEMTHLPALLPESIIGIPTFEGLEFVKVNQIIRCEGIQRCTRIYLDGLPNIVSSYSIGEFEKMLRKHSFFMCHKSHLVNLHCIRKYHKNGTLIMIDHSNVPVSRRRKKHFIERVSHI